MSGTIKSERYVLVPVPEINKVVRLLWLMREEMRLVRELIGILLIVSGEVGCNYNSVKFPPGSD